MKLLVVNNLSSGKGTDTIYEFIRALVQDGDEVVIRATDGTTDLRTFLGDAEKFDFVVASGGDGTVTTIAYFLAGTGIPVLPFPAGTANLLATNLASPTESHALASMTREMRLMDFDMGEIELANGEHMGFSIMAGAGYDATIMQGAAAGKKILGQMAYFTSAVASATPQHADFKITIDGKTIESSGVGILIANFSKIQFDISLIHENLPRDGVFDVVILNTKDAFGLIPALFACILDRSGDFPARTDALEIYRGTEVHVESNPALLVQYDGEVTGHTTPFTVRMLPRAARYIVSKDCLDAFSMSGGE